MLIFFKRLLRFFWVSFLKFGKEICEISSNISFDRLAQAHFQESFFSSVNSLLQLSTPTGKINEISTQLTLVLNKIDLQRHFLSENVISAAI